MYDTGLLSDIEAALERSRQMRETKRRLLEDRVELLATFRVTLSEFVERRRRMSNDFNYPPKASQGQPSSFGSLLSQQVESLLLNLELERRDAP